MLGDLVELAAGDARKLTVVLRRAVGDPLEVVDSSGRAFAATLTTCDARGACAALEREISTPAPARLRITLAQGMPKGQKMDYVVEKATELGIARLVPFASERTLGDMARDGKVERWRRLARSAALQSGRADVMEVRPPVAFAELLELCTTFDLALVPWELAGHVPLRERLPGLLAGKRTVCIVIGPEGGLSHEEARRAEMAGGRLVSLGTRILRTETAGLVACGALLYESGDL